MTSCKCAKSCQQSVFMVLQYNGVSGPLCIHVLRMAHTDSTHGMYAYECYDWLINVQGIVGRVYHVTASMHDVARTLQLQFVYEPRSYFQHSNAEMLHQTRHFISSKRCFTAFCETLTRDFGSAALRSALLKSCTNWRLDSGPGSKLLVSQW